MRIRAGRHSIPYPKWLLEGKLLLCGVSRDVANSLLSTLTMSDEPIKSLDTLYSEVRSLLDSRYSASFDMLVQFEKKCRMLECPPLIVVLEGASATGKSMLSLPLLQSVSATRVLSTDSIRQLLRATLSETDVPELYCHTYQAFKHRQLGPEELNPMIRGYLAQIHHITPTLRSSVKRFISEGANAIIEGVHIVPGSLSELSEAILEILVHPDTETHRAMFHSKGELSGLHTITSDSSSREEEFKSTRRIQEYLFESARTNGVSIVELQEYDSAISEIHSFVLEKIRALLSSSRK